MRNEKEKKVSGITREGILEPYRPIWPPLLAKTFHHDSQWRFVGTKLHIKAAVSGSSWKSCELAVSPRRVGVYSAESGGNPKLFVGFPAAVDEECLEVTGHEPPLARQIAGGELPAGDPVLDRTY
jgi:hypothetical protein